MTYGFAHRGFEYMNLKEGLFNCLELTIRFPAMLYLIKARVFKATSNTLMVCLFMEFRDATAVHCCPMDALPLLFNLAL